MTKQSISTAFVVLAFTSTHIGCVPPSAIIKNSGPTMQELIVDGRRVDSSLHSNRRSAYSLNDARSAQSVKGYTRESMNEIDQLFPTLPNPEIAIYVFPHLSTEDRVPVPGYTTSISLYASDEYALPGEPTAQ